MNQNEVIARQATEVLELRDAVEHERAAVEQQRKDIQEHQSAFAEICEVLGMHTHHGNLADVIRQRLGDR